MIQIWLLLEQGYCKESVLPLTTFGTVQNISYKPLLDSLKGSLLLGPFEYEFTRITRFTSKPDFQLGSALVLHGLHRDFLYVRTALLLLMAVCLNPTALKMAKTEWSFGHFECNRVKVNIPRCLLFWTTGNSVHVPSNGLFFCHQNFDSHSIWTAGEFSYPPF